MSRFTFRFLSELGQPCSEQLLDAPSDEEAMELARLLRYPSVIIVLEEEREVGAVWPDHNPDGGAERTTER